MSSLSFFSVRQAFSNKKMARKVATLSHIFFATRSANKGKREAARCQSVISHKQSLTCGIGIVLIVLFCSLLS